MKPAHKIALDLTAHYGRNGHTVSGSGGGSGGGGDGGGGGGDGGGGGGDAGADYNDGRARKSLPARHLVDLRFEPSCIESNGIL